MKDYEALVYLKATGQLFASFPVQAENLNEADLKAHIIYDVGDEDMWELKVEEAE